MEVQVYKPSMEDDGGGGGGGSDQRFDRAAAEMMTVGQCQSIGDMDDSQLVGAPALVTGNEARAEVKLEEKSSGKKRRGRPPGVHARAKSTPLKRKNEEEDVCFICFDGGSLVLCDRRGCPKAYHPACIKRDESFFKSKAKWNCGWHICSSCQKAAHYMCYTCTYSLCKGCIKDADYQCIRGGSKGFCGTCMRTIMLIENAEGNKEAVQVDFDDKSSWEYLFKVYWMLLKEQLSLTLDDLVEAKNPWKDAAVMACKGVAPGSLYVDNKTKDSDSPNSCVDMEASISSGSNKKPKISDGRTSSPEGTIWASKELLEFVAHMNNGNVSVLSQFDVQALLLEYIKKNNLRDPHRKCQIICDLRLRKIFGKECVGHFEMLKLLEYHFLVKETSTAENTNGAGATEMEIDGNYDNLMMMGSDKRRKTRRKMDERGPHSNPDAYAAIDVHNIKLIYLPRNLIETLIDDADKFHEKVVGSIVRMRVSSSDEKQDTYRLVQIIGTNKVAEGYKIGKRTIDVKLEILNLDKKEVISINEVSNQAFSQDECKRLRQSIRCGLIKRFTVGEIQDKARALRAIRVNEELEAEVLRLSHLRDRASEKGHRKELREFVEKLQLLDSPEERQRRLHEIPEVHSDSKMDPSYESDGIAGESEKKQDDTIKPSKSVIGRKGREPFSPRRKCDIPNLPNNTGSKVQKNQGREAFGTNGWSIKSNQANISGLVPCVRNSESATGSNTLSEFASEISSVSASVGMNNNLSDESFETEKIWHYQDPTGKIQGPFAMVQLCKWSTTGAFPADHRIWRTNENQDDSILLTDALNGQYYKEPLLTHGSNMHIQGFTVPLDEGNNCHVGWKKSLNATVTHDKQIEESLNTKQDGQSLQKTVDTELVRSTTTSDIVNTNEKQIVIQGKQIEESQNTKQEDQSIHKSFAAELVRSTTPADVANTNEEQTGILLQTCDSLKGNNSPPNQPQDCTSLTSPVLPVKPFETLSHEEGEGRAEDSSDHRNEDVDHRQCNENRSDSEGQSGQSSGQNWRPPNANSPSNGFDSNPDFVPVTKSFMTSEQDEKILAPDFPSPPPKPSNDDLRGQAAEIKESGSSDVPVQDVGPSWSSSNLVAGEEQLHKVAGEWGGYSPTPARLSIEEWDSNLMSTSSLKPNETASDCVSTPVSVSGQLTEPISSHHTSNASGWHAILAEANAFCTLAADESVSDLLAEVEAMESLSGLATPTSIMNCGGEFTEGSKNDSISSVEGFSPAHEPGKGDALSSTCDLQLSFQPMVIDETPGACHANVLDLQQRRTVDASTMAEVQENRKPSDVSINSLEANVLVDQLEAGEIQNAAPSKECWDMATTDNSWKARLESTDTNLEAVHGNADVSLGGSDNSWKGRLESTDTNLEAVHGNAGVSLGGSQQQREDGLDLQQRPGLNSSTSAELEGYRKPCDISVNKLEENVSVNQLDLEPGEIPTTAPAKESWDTSSTDNACKARLDSTETSSEADIGNEHIGWGGSDRGGANMGRGGLYQGIANVGRGGSYQGTANMGWRGGQGTIPGNSIMNSGTPAGQSRYGGDRLGPRDRGFQNRGLGRGRFVGNRPAPYGNANGGGSFRPPQKGQRVCKYFESGYCKKGAACSYLHP